MASTTITISSSLKVTIYSDPRGFSAQWIRKNIKNTYGVYINRSTKNPDYFRIGAGGVGSGSGSGSGKLQSRLIRPTYANPADLTQALSPWAPILILEFDPKLPSLPDRFTNCLSALFGPNPAPPSFKAKAKDQIAYKALACEHFLFGLFAQEHYCADVSILEVNKAPLTTSRKAVLDSAEPNNHPQFLSEAIQDENQILINKAATCNASGTRGLIPAIENILKL